MTCTCSSQPSDVLSETEWLDARNEVRTAYLAHLIEGSLPKEFNGTILPVGAGLGECATEETSPFIRTSDELRIWLDGMAVSDEATPLSMVPEEARYKFFNSAQFVDVFMDGRRVRYLYSIAFDFLFREHYFTYLDMFKTMAAFGVSPEKATRCYHQFGSWVDPYCTCQRKLFFYCGCPGCRGGNRPPLQ